MEPGIDRPQSALARGVQITEFKESQVNPEPIVLEETDLLMEQYLSPRKLVGCQKYFDIKQLLLFEHRKIKKRCVLTAQK